MDSEIYVNNNEIIETYCVSINESKLLSVQADIDKFYGKGQLKQMESDRFTFNSHNSNKKIEIVSKTYVGPGTIFDSSYPEVIDVSIYLYEYYAYCQSELSKICDLLVKSYGKLDLSRYIKFLCEYEPRGYDEELFIKRIFDCIKMKKIDCGELVKSDISLTKKENVLKRIVKAIKKEGQKPFIVVAPLSYEVEVEKQIKRLEENESKEKLKTIEYGIEKRNEVKRNVLDSLPKETQINTRR